MRKIASAAEVTTSPEKASGPAIKNHKINPPASGCYVGFWTLWEHGLLLPGPSLSDLGLVEPRTLAEHAAVSERICGGLGAREAEILRTDMESYQRDVGGKPYIVVNRMHAKMWMQFPTEISVMMNKLGAVPLIYAALETTVRLRLNPQLEDIASGKHDQFIAKYARGARAFGETYGGFFVTTQHESNLPIKWGVPHWAGQKERSPDLFNKAWQHIWNVFDGEGANEYATWLIEWWSDNPIGDYYPGDKYVDWVGLSSMNWASWIYQYKFFPFRDLQDIMSKNVDHLHKYHPDKPIMLAEISSYRGSPQAKWMTKAFQAIKSRPEIKAVLVLDTTFPAAPVEDLTLTPESRQALRETFKDPYWILAH